MLCWCDKTVVDCWSNYPKPPSKATCPHPHVDQKDSKPAPAPKPKKTEEEGEEGEAGAAEESTLVLFASSWHFVPMRVVKWLFG